ncbi:metal-dependent hydrolase [Haladaptatus sp. NG-SE-30]
MWPWGHLAVGYLAYSLYIHVRHRRAPTGSETLLLAIGTQFPDLIDKPLAWTWNILPSGRSFAHSLFTMILVIAVVRSVSRRVGRPLLGQAFAIGYLLHLPADGLAPFVSGEYEYLAFLLWPVVPAPDYGFEPGILAHLLAFELSGVAKTELLIFGFVFVIWIYDGAPGTRR